MTRFHYELVEENLISPECGPYISYGIRGLLLDRDNETELAFVADITTQIAFAANLIIFCNTYQLNPIHLFEIAADAVVHFTSLPQSYCGCL